MKTFDRALVTGACLMGAALIGYALYELVLWPAAGFPTTDLRVIVAGANTLRVGHLLKFAYAAGLALIAVGAHARLREGSPLLAALMAHAAAAAATLFVASGMLGLRILQAAGDLLAERAFEAEVVIYSRVVTLALFQAAVTLTGVFALLLGVAGLRTRALPRSVAAPGLVFGPLFILDFVLPEPLLLAGPLLAIGWALWIALRLGVLTRGGEASMAQSPVPAAPRS